MDADGSNQVSLGPNGSESDTEPDWSPDGTKIVVQSFRDDPKATEIYVLNADGSNPTRLTTDGSHNIRPSWSPDGTKIAFLSTRDGNGEIYAMDANGSNQTPITTNTAKDEFPDWGRLPSDLSAPAPPAPIPTTTTWGLITLGGLSFIALLWRLRRKYSRYGNRHAFLPIHWRALSVF